MIGSCQLLSQLRIMHLNLKIISLNSDIAQSEFFLAFLLLSTQNLSALVSITWSLFKGLVLVSSLLFVLLIFTIYCSWNGLIKMTVDHREIVCHFDADIKVLHEIGTVGIVARALSALDMNYTWCGYGIYEGPFLSTLI